MIDLIFWRGCKICLNKLNVWGISSFNGCCFGVGLFIIFCFCFWFDLGVLEMVWIFCFGKLVEGFNLERGEWWGLCIVKNLKYELDYDVD